MKKISYKACIRDGGELFFADKTIECSTEESYKEALLIAAAESQDGEYTVDDDGAAMEPHLTAEDRLGKLEDSMAQLPELIKNAIAMALTGKG